MLIPTAERVKARRIEQRLTQAALAGMAKMRELRLKEIEGGAEPTTAEIVRLGQALKVPQAYLRGENVPGEELDAIPEWAEFQRKLKALPYATQRRIVHWMVRGVDLYVKQEGEKRGF